MRIVSLSLMALFLPFRAGYIAEYDIERAARDARLGPIGGGTDEIMKEILGRSLGL